MASWHPDKVNDELDGETREEKRFASKSGDAGEFAQGPALVITPSTSRVVERFRNLIPKHMYKDFFGLKEYPFTLTPDPRFIVFSPSYNELLAALYYGVEMAKGLIVLTGEVGTGKTTALRWLIRRLDLTVLAAYINNPAISIEEFYHHLTEMLGIRDWTNKTDLLMKMGKMLEERHSRDLRTLLILEESHELPDEILEEIRLLLNFESDGAKHLQIILTGQLALRERLNQQNLRQLKQLVALRCQMPIVSTVEEVKRYIQMRISTGGSVENDIFTSEAVDLIYECSQGIPRLINNLCDNAMISAFALETRTIDREIIEEVAENLDLLPDRDVPLASAERVGSATRDIDAAAGNAELLPDTMGLEDDTILEA